MVGYDERQKELSEFWHATAGILSGMSTRFLCQPLDVLKIRFQLQHEPFKRSKKNYYWGIVQASRRILEEESYRALWKGHVPAQLLSGVYGLVQFGTFEFLTKAAHLHITDQHKTAVYFVSGSISGAIATAVSFPLDTIRTRLVGQGEPKVYKGVFHAVHTMVKVEGVSALYRGMIPALLQIMPHAGAQFSAFNLFSQLLLSEQSTMNGTSVCLMEKSQKSSHFWKNLLAGSAAGLVAKLFVYPFDLTKKRLQIQGFEGARKKFGKVQKYDGLFHCFRLVLKDEGFSGLYKGISASLLKAVLTSGLMFGIYEEILRKIRDLT